MQLPNADCAVVDPMKVTHYLLSTEHPVGRTKARLFRSLGFVPHEPEEMIHALRELARAGVVASHVVSVFGTKYIVDGALQAPNGWTVTVRSIWIVREPGEPPQFVTAFPR